MDIINISDKLSNISLVWKKFVQNIEAKNKVNVSITQGEYFPWVVAAGAKKDDFVCIVCRDHVWVTNVESELKNNGLNDVIGLPSAWSQISREEMAILSAKLDEVLKKKAGIIVVSQEDFKGDWEFEWLLGLEIFARQNYRFASLSNQLVKSGYIRVPKVTEEGEYAIMGDIWWIWGVGEKQPYKLFFENDLLSSIIVGDNAVEKVNLSGQLVRSEEKKQLKVWLDGLGLDVVLAYGLEEKNEVLAKKYILVNCLGLNSSNVLSFPLGNLGWMVGGRENFLSIIDKKKPVKNIVISNLSSEVKQWLYDEKTKLNNWQFLSGDLSIGGCLESEKIIVWTDRELFRITRKNVVTKTKKEVNWQKMIQFKVGDLVVHSDHGIGLLKDFVTRNVGDTVKDYFVVSYAKGDVLYVPTEQLHKLAKYVGSKLVKLNRLGSMVWGKRKHKVLKQVEKMAKDLLRLYAKRKLIKRDPYVVDQDYLDKLDESFGHELTDDQKKSLRDINDDLEQNFPMDRLLCGDVGFGKTEIAIRAAAKVVLGGKQVAVLVPTTVLAEQHFITFVERLNVHKIRVEVLSRLRDKDHQKNVLENLKKGRIDVLIGTHRLLQKDVDFKNLGLIVIDEEQKFGVRAKEQLKRLRAEIDVLSMSATPIPRTLNMSMGGVRDLSILETPPLGRRSIETNVIPYSIEVIKEAVERELARNGQVFIVHNRVRTIGNLVYDLKEVFGDKVKIGMAHGRMSENTLAETMNKFAKKEYDVLVATTIVENGLDLPNVNTLVVENATGLGLSQLYQLRGRVGRSSTKAYAYFFYHSEKLKDKAKQRLDALSSAKELGSGLKLAIADMEIRGVGNILGLQQHGNAYSVGLGMFLDMLSEMVEKLKTNQEYDQIMEEKDIIIDLPVSFSVPKYYVEKIEDRILLEQKIAAQSYLDGFDQLAKNTIQRYGVMPDECVNLFNIGKVRILAEKLKIKQIMVKTQNMINGSVQQNFSLLFEKEINLDWVKFLFEQSNKWTFRNNEALIGFEDLPGDLLGWLLNLMMAAEKMGE